MTSLLATAQGYLLHRRLDEARDLGARILGEQPSKEAVQFLAEVASAYRQSGQIENALSILHQIEPVVPNTPFINFNVGLTHYERVELQFDGFTALGDPTPDLMAAKARFERAAALQPNMAQAHRGVLMCQLALNDVYQTCLTSLTYMKLQPEDTAFPESFKDLQLRLMMEKSLRSAPVNAEGGEVPPATGPRDAWEEKAVGEVTRLITSDILGPAIVYFHVELGDRHPFLRGGDNNPKTKVDYLAALATSCRCARMTQPGVKIILVSDETTPLDGFNDADYVVRLPREPMHLMYARVRACRAVVLSHRLRGPVLFLDTDVCLNRDFTPLFDGSFDVALSYRSSIRFPLMPINEGLMLGDTRRPGALAHFFARYIDLYDWLAEQQQVKDRYGFDVRFWRGGQLALAAFAAWRVPPSVGETVERHGLRCRFLHCISFNHSVQPEEPLGALDDKWALHFKGLLPKAKMSEYLAHVEKSRKS